MVHQSKIKEHYYTLITGASSGIGKELAFRYAKEGYNLILTARREDKLKELQKKIKKEHSILIQIIPCDLFKIKNPLMLFKIIQDQGWNIQTLIHNAGVGDYNLFSQSNWKKIDQMLQLNIKSILHLTHLFLPKLQQTPNSSIIFISSIASFMPGPYLASYYASKAFITSFSNALFSENQNKVHILNACPGPLATNFGKTAGLKMDRLKFFMLPVSEACNLIYKAHLKKKRQIILGKWTQFIAFLNFILPTSWILKLTYLFNR